MTGRGALALGALALILVVTAACSIDAALTQFRSALGTLNPNVIGSLSTGRREVNWDGVPAALTNTTSFPAGFFNEAVVGRARGVVFTTDGSGLSVADDDLAFINPEFVERDGMQLEEEGCLSVPGFNATVARPSRAVVKGLNREGEEQTVEGTGLLARCFQHEIDHLDGTLFVDRLRGLQKDLILRKVRKLSRAGKW